MSETSFSIAITGAGGSGAVTTGMILLEAMADKGYYGYMIRSSGPQIRGGESAVMLRFDIHEIFSTNDYFDYLLSMDWFNIERFSDEIPLNRQSRVFYDSAAGDIPQVISNSGCQLQGFDLKKLAKKVAGGRANMIGLGLLARIFSLTEDNITTAVKRVLGRKGKEVVQASVSAILSGQSEADSLSVNRQVVNHQNPHQRWNISGNEACGLGALQAGVRFVAAYPITPATEILEWLSPRLLKLGGGLLQAEDELASINMIIGSSFGGVPSLTATSGPGLSLMMEGLGLAVTSETPLVVVNVMRGGPSTGIPTKSEQSDLNIALYGFHGDAPHLVLSALNIADAVLTSRWAVCLAEQLQTVAIVLSDQSMGQSRVIIDELPELSMACQRKIAQSNDYSADHPYQRYQLQDDGVSPMSLPGEPGLMYTADGLEHSQSGTPSSMNIDHQQQMLKRKQKIEQFDYGQYWANIDGSGTIVLITWGSSSAMVAEAAQRLRQQALDCKVIALRLIMPLAESALIEQLENSSKIFVIEQNQGSQLFHYLHALKVLPDNALTYARPGPLPMRPGEIAHFIKENI